MAGELRATSSWPRSPATGCSTTSPSSASSTRRAAGTPSSSASPRSSSSRSTATRRWPGAACGRGSPAASRRPSGSRRDSVRLAEHARRARRADALHRAAGGRAARAGPPARAAAGDRAPRRRTSPHAAAWRGVLPLAYLDAGDRDRARAAYDRALEGGPEAMPGHMLWLTAMSVAGRGGGRARRPRRRRSGCTPRSSPYADRLIQWSFTGNAGSVHRVLGRTAAAAGRHDRARDHFEAALERHAALGAAALLARTRCDYGELLLRRQGRRPQAGARAPARGGRRGAPPRDARHRRPRRAIRLTVERRPCSC